MNERDRLAINDSILRRTIDEKLRRCERGVDQYLG
jgi:hypothetical protein